MTVQGTDLSMTRGDSETITVTCSAEPFDVGDVLTLTIRPTVEDDIVLQKTVNTFVSNQAIFSFAPSDTEPLEFGDYVYDIQVVRADGTVTTIIKPAKFTIEEEVTY